MKALYLRHHILSRHLSVLLRFNITLQPGLPSWSQLHLCLPQEINPIWVTTHFPKRRSGEGSPDLRSPSRTRTTRRRATAAPVSIPSDPLPDFQELGSIAAIRDSPTSFAEMFPFLQRRFLHSILAASKRLKPSFKV